MSWRIRIEPYGRTDPEDEEWQDWRLDAEASEAEIRAVCQAAYGWRPLKVYTVTTESATLRQLVRMLDTEFCVPPGEYSVWTPAGEVMLPEEDYIDVDGMELDAAFKLLAREKAGE